MDTHGLQIMFSLLMVGLIFGLPFYAVGIYFTLRAAVNGLQILLCVKKNPTYTEKDAKAWESVARHFGLWFKANRHGPTMIHGNYKSFPLELKPYFDHATRTDSLQIGFCHRPSLGLGLELRVVPKPNEPLLRFGNRPTVLTGDADFDRVFMVVCEDKKRMGVLFDLQVRQEMLRYVQVFNTLQMNDSGVHMILPGFVTDCDQLESIIHAQLRIMSAVRNAQQKEGAALSLVEV